MAKSQILPLLGFCALVAACSSTPNATYSGTVQRIEDRDYTGYVVSPISPNASAAVNPLHVFVSVIDPASRKPEIVCIDFLDASSQGAFGRSGDHVVFTIRGTLPPDLHIPGEALISYRVQKVSVN